MMWRSWILLRRILLVTIIYLHSLINLSKESHGETRIHCSDFSIWNSKPYNLIFKGDSLVNQIYESSSSSAIFHTKILTYLKIYYISLNEILIEFPSYSSIDFK